MRVIAHLPYMYACYCASTFLVLSTPNAHYGSHLAFDTNHENGSHHQDVTNTKYSSHSFNETYLAKGSHCEVDTNVNYGLGLKDCDLNSAVTIF